MVDEWIALAKVIIERPGVDCKAQAADGISALSFVTRARHSSSINVLIPLLHRIGARDKDALGDLVKMSWTSFSGYCAAGTTLLVMDESVASYTFKSASTLLANALKNGFDDAAVVLLEKGFRTVPPRDALRFAAAGGCATSIEFLCRAPIPLVSVDAVFESKKTALHIACYRGHAAATIALLECGADPSARDEYNMLPLT